MKSSIKKYLVQNTGLLNNNPVWHSQLPKKFMAESISMRLPSTGILLVNSSYSYSKFYTITEKGLVKNDSEINLHCLDMGKIIILTNHNISGKELLDMYSNKDVVEKYFDTMKNELDEKRLRVSSKDIFSGRLFITFISLILRTYIGNISNKASLNKTFSLSEIFSNLKLIRHVTKDKGGYYLTEISKHQRFIFDNLQCKYPLRILLGY